MSTQTFSHLNLPDEVRACIRSVSDKQWQEFFESLKRTEYSSMGLLSEKQLTELQARVNMLDTIRGIFTSLKQTSTNP